VSFRLRRFSKLEPKRPAGEEMDLRRPSVGSRFDAGGPQAAEGPSAGLTDGGQLVVCCALCHADAEPTAEVCRSCGASFSTPEQRAFNEALEQRRRQARERRAQAEAEAAEARRVLEERLRREAEARRQEASAGLERVRSAHESFRRDPVGHVAREIGGGLGRALRRLLPHPLARLAFVLGVMGSVFVLAFLVPAVRALLCVGFLALVVLFSLFNRAVRVFGRF
jgi:hypothetical protein